ncbi:dihydropteroate synthase [Candidatus Peregrinibacteria bacterium RIFOXYB2_FULL_32_7]|nr:MAG: dihydropteroate synthase [Candidatus Peregrinibacteria bacterium RIFOXYB2_FULL_32_7]
MGILNVTVDSFFDGGKYLEEKCLSKRLKQIMEEGADIIDIGAQSTFAGRKEVPFKEESEKILNAMKIFLRTKDKEKILISIDTYQSQVAQIALENGADMINDVTAMRKDPLMPEVIAKFGCPIVLMYAKEDNARTTMDNVDYDDIISVLKKFFEERISFAISRGVKKEQIILDPGMGFFISGKAKYSFEILHRLKELKEYFKLPILVGTSRKSFLSCGGKYGPEERLEGSLISAGIAVLNGANLIRAHDVKATKKVLEIIKNMYNTDTN